MDQAVFSRTQTRWIRLRLFQSIQPRIVYCPRKANIVADALSRSLHVDAETPQEAEAQAISGSRVTMEELEKQWQDALEADTGL